MAHRILVLDNVDPKAIDVLTATPGFEVVAPGGASREQVLEMLPNFDALVIRSATKADAALINAAPNLKIIARAGVGVDNVDLDAATAKGVVVVNTPGGNTIATAEHTFALLLAAARQIPRAHQSMREGRWDRKLFMGTELRGKTLGIVGFGRIGRAVAKRALAFEMIVLAYDPFVDHAEMRALGVESVPLDALFARADVVTLHTAINPDTRQLVNADTLARMKRGVILVNAARGALIDEAALADALKSGQVGAAALDVYEPEPPSPDNPLIGLDNVVHTPHLAASTSDAQVTVAVEAAELIVAALTTGDYQNVCNPAVLAKS